MWRSRWRRELILTKYLNTLTNSKSPMARTYIKDLKVGEKVTVKGWLHEIRGLAKVKFLILRDYTGIIQCVATSDNEELFKKVKTLNNKHGTYEKKLFETADPRWLSKTLLLISAYWYLKLTNNPTWMPVAFK